MKGINDEENNEMMIDTGRLRADLVALARECRALKDMLTTTWTRPMADEQRKLARLRWKVTELCVLRAFSRGRLHVRSVEAPKAWHAAIAERVGKDYAEASAGAEASADALADAEASADANALALAEGGAR